MIKKLLDEIKWSKYFQIGYNYLNSKRTLLSKLIVSNIELIHWVSMIVWMTFLVITFFQFKKQIWQTQTQINQIQEQLDDSKEEFVENQKYAKMKFIHEIYLPFENEPISSMLYAYRKRDNEFLKQFSDDDNVQLLNHVEYVLWVDEKVDIDDEDFALNFNWIFEIVCSRKYFVWEKWLIIQRWGYSGILKKCEEEF